jgi:hypothetical protein
MRFVAALMIVAGWPGIAHAHPGVQTHAGALTYMISSIVTVLLVAGCVAAGRRAVKR